MEWVSGWGQYPRIQAEIKSPQSISDAQRIVSEKTLQACRGLGRSYGDSSLAEEIISSLGLLGFISFKKDTGLLECYAGVSLDEILRQFLPLGWFLPVTPGTKFVTLGGAIASDAHGKNHHIHGSFSDHVLSFHLLLPNGEMVRCSKRENADLFKATCGGMGLTGVIVKAKLKLIPIQSSTIEEKIIRTRDLAESLELLHEYSKATYSVAWIDCLAAGKSMGRSLMMLGEHAAEGDLAYKHQSKLSVPFDMPDVLLNNHFIQAFNHLYYQRIRKKELNRKVNYEPFFYPLDFIHHWNRLYGKTGFTQYQFVLPLESGEKGLKEILSKISSSKMGSFLAVLKVFGKGNSNYLSFPIEGYTLALDFKISDLLFPLLDELDKLVLHYGGRIYLAKDVRMSKETFRKSYPKWEKFMEVRKKYGADKKFVSLQSKRLGL